MMERNTNNLEKFFKKDNSLTNYYKEYISYLSSILYKLDVEKINKIIDVFINAKKNNNKIFFIGNGGSASTSSHFMEDLNNVSSFKSISLTDNIACITALGNDNGYENIFLGQLKNLFSSGDVVVGISASGKSPNIIKAIEYVNNNNGISVGLIGFDGGIMKNICKYYIHIETMKDEFGPVEDIHIILCHLICTYLKFRLNDDDD